MDDAKQSYTVKIAPGQVPFERNATIPIKYDSSSAGNFVFWFITSYRTLSIHVEDRPSAPNSKAADPSDGIRQIDVHTIDNDEVFRRYSTHPKLGLEHAAVERKSMEGKNVISPPPTQYALIVHHHRA